MKKYKRQSKHLTDYGKRLKLVLSNRLRLVIRRSNKNLISQIVDYGKGGDKVLASAYSKELEKYGWKYTRKNIPAAYLTGLLCGLKGRKKGVKEAIVDKGLQKSCKGGVVYTVVKGVIDAGINIPSSKEIFPKEDRIRGEHIRDNKITKWKVIPENIVNDFEKIKEKIIKENE